MTQTTIVFLILMCAVAYLTKRVITAQLNKSKPGCKCTDCPVASKIKQNKRPLFVSK